LDFQGRVLPCLVVGMQWKQIRYRLEWAGVKMLGDLIPRLSRRNCARLARVVGGLAFKLDKHGRKVTLANIEAALGDEYTKEEQERIGRGSYETFARTMLDLFWAPRLARHDGMQYVDVVGLEHLDSELGKPCVVLCAHHAGVEWASIACGLHGYRGCVLTQAFKNPLLNKLFTDLRTCTGQEILTQDMSMLRMLRRLKKGELVGLLIDLNLPPSQSATVLDTFGMKMCATYLHAILAQRTGARLVPMTGNPLPDGSCKVTLHPALEIPEGATGQEIAQMAWDFLEKIIRERPEQWMWVYKHWRFKPKGATHRYPYYSHESGKFEKLVRAIGEESGAGKEG
jgi:Kdo2-lipid IVA lauroyltransferase/acyltransferase